MTISKEKIKTEYFSTLKSYRVDIKILEQEERLEAIEHAKNYYSYLLANNISYAKLALDVIEDKGAYGKLANIHLKSQSIFEGVSLENIEEVREKIIIMLAYNDAKMRKSSKYNIEEPNYDKIEKYHIKVFECFTTAYAWGGLAPRELMGGGSWMQYYLQEKNIFDGISEIIEKHGEYSKKTKYSVERMLQSVAHSYKLLSLGIDIPFDMRISAYSSEVASKTWDIPSNRIEEIEEDTSMLDSVSSKVFKGVAAKSCTPLKDPDYTSGDSEEEPKPINFSANKAINKQLKESIKGHPNAEEIERKIEESEQEMATMEKTWGQDKSAAKKAEKPEGDWMHSLLHSHESHYAETKDFLKGLSGAHHFPWEDQ